MNELEELYRDALAKIEDTPEDCKDILNKKPVDRIIVEKIEYTRIEVENALRNLGLYKAEDSGEVLITGGIIPVFISEKDRLTNKNNVLIVGLDNNGGLVKKYLNTENGEYQNYLA